MNKKKCSILAGCGFFAVLALVLTVTLFNREKQVCYVSFDVNPSIELQTDKNCKVTEVNGANEGAKKVLDGLSLIGEDVNEAAEDIINVLEESGYFGEGLPNQMLVTVSDNSMAEETLEKVNAGIALAMEGKEFQVQLMKQTIMITEEDIQEARSYEISAGKQHFIRRILQEDESLTMDELSSVSIRDLTAYAIKSNIDLTELLDDRQDILEDIMENAMDHENTDDADEMGEASDKTGTGISEDDMDDVDDSDDMNGADDADDMNETDDADNVGDIDDADDADNVGDIDDADDADDQDDVSDADDADDMNEADDTDDMIDQDDVSDADDADDMNNQDDTADDMDDQDDVSDAGDTDDQDDISDADDADDQVEEIEPETDDEPENDGDSEDDDASDAD